MDLQQEIDAKRAEIRSDSYPMSIGEWISMYESDPPEIDIHPEFQRFYRWDIWQKSRLIESILLGIPIPPIFVSQRDDGVWDVIDGLQRLSTIYEFVGALKNENDEVLPPLVLEETKYLPSLKGAIWDADNFSGDKARPVIQPPLIEDENSKFKPLTPTQRLIIKRTKIQASIILRESDERSKYDLFQRLNTGGSSLSDQELRNCILVSINQPMYERIRKLSDDENFMSCVNLTDKAIDEQYDMELVLRFLIFRNLEGGILKNIGDLDDFLTKRMEKMAFSDEFDLEKEESYFRRTFELLARTTKGNSFRRYDAVKDRFLGGFLVSAFEAVALGIGYNLDLIGETAIDVAGIIKKLWQMQEFTKNAGSGVRASTRVAKVIPLSRGLFQP